MPPICVSSCAHVQMASDAGSCGHAARVLRGVGSSDVLHRGPRRGDGRAGSVEAALQCGRVLAYVYASKLWALRTTAQPNAFAVHDTGGPRGVAAVPSRETGCDTVVVGDVVEHDGPLSPWMSLVGSTDIATPRRVRPLGGTPESPQTQRELEVLCSARVVVYHRSIACGPVGPRTAAICQHGATVTHTYAEQGTVNFA